MKKRLIVVGAIFIENDKIFYAKRGAAKNSQVAYKYEFVGGKVEEGESEENALLRELKEEMDLTAEVISHFRTIEYEYEPYIVRLSVYLCSMTSDYRLKEHVDAGWIPLKEIDPADWAPADEEILKALI